MDKIQSHEAPYETNQKSGMGCALGRRPEKDDSVKSDVVRTPFIFYRLVLKPLLRVFSYFGCRFHPSCSQYAEALLQEKISPINLAKIIGRVCRCNSWTTPVLTFDPPTPDYLFKKI